MPVTHVDTPSGPAGLHVDGPEGAPGRVVLGHGAGGGVEALDLRAARDAAVGLGLQRCAWSSRGGCAGAGSPSRRPAWTPPGSPRSPSSPRCRAWWAAAAPAPAWPVGRRAPSPGSAACSASPFRVPPRGGASRAGELALPDVPRLVVQGERDAFGVPEPGPGVRVHVVPGADHAFAVPRRLGLPAGPQVREVVAAWLAELLPVPATRQALT